MNLEAVGNMRRKFRWAGVIMALVTLCVVCSPAMAADPYLSDVIKKPNYARTLRSLLGRAGNLPNWTGEILKPKGSYVGGTLTYASVGGINYEVFFNCEPQNCN